MCKVLWLSRMEEKSAAWRGHVTLGEEGAHRWVHTREKQMQKETQAAESGLVQVCLESSSVGYWSYKKLVTGPGFGPSKGDNNDIEESKNKINTNTNINKNKDTINNYEINNNNKINKG